MALATSVPIAVQAARSPVLVRVRLGHSDHPKARLLDSTANRKMERRGIALGESRRPSLIEMVM